ncbi:MASE1 domain-containing protein, partial [Atlantibacter sp.]|uniref:MASE1 domain-containing protein n=1 Tax=Atlantibacter sp. TaxID=1903473 RepID=UPI0028ADC903
MNKKNMRVEVSTPHPVLRLLSLGLLSFLFTLFSLELTLLGSSLAPLWFPTAIMMVAFYRHPASFWPAIAAACVAGNLLASLILFPSNHIVITFPVINILEALLGAILLRKLLP